MPLKLLLLCEGGYTYCLSLPYNAPYRIISVLPSSRRTHPSVSASERSYLRILQRYHPSYRAVQLISVLRRGGGRGRILERATTLDSPSDEQSDSTSSNCTKRREEYHLPLDHDPTFSPDHGPCYASKRLGWAGLSEAYSKYLISSSDTRNARGIRQDRLREIGRRPRERV